MVDAFKRGLNMDEIKKDVLEAGFKSVKIWRQSTNMNIVSAKEMYDTCAENLESHEKFKALSAEEQGKVKEQVIAEMDKELGDDVLDPKGFESTVIIARN